MQNQPVMRMQLVVFWRRFLELFLNRQRCFSGCQSSSIADAKYMRVDGDGRLGEGHVQDDIRGLAPYTGQRLQRIAVARYFAVVFLFRNFLLTTRCCQIPPQLGAANN